MSLQIREIEVDNLPSAGIVEVEDKRTPHILKEAQKNFALKGTAINAPNLEQRLNGEEIKGRIIPYSQILCQMYNALGALKSKMAIHSSDTEDLKALKETEGERIAESLKELKPLIKAVVADEFSSAKVDFREATERKPAGVRLDTKVDAKEINFSADKAQSLANIIVRNRDITKNIEWTSPTFQQRLLKEIDNSGMDILNKHSGEDVRQKIKTDDEILIQFKSKIEMLISEDSPDRPVDRDRAEKDLARELGKHGLNLIRIPVEDRTPQEEAINQAKSCILRASWDGFIERPRSTEMLSPAMQDNVYQGNPKTDPKIYDLNKSPIWRLCQKVEGFRKFNFAVKKELSNIGFPAERVAELSYADIAYLINVNRQQTSDKVQKIQGDNKEPVDGIRIFSERYKFNENVAKEHRADIEIMLRANGMSEREAKEAVDAMQKGVGKILDGHHPYNISDPAYYERVTGKPFTAMNKEVKFFDKKVHKLIHMLENGVNRGGRIVMNDAKISNRTVFVDKNTGKKFYYSIQPKEGIDGITGFNYNVIYNHKYLSDLDHQNAAEANTQGAKELTKAIEEPKKEVATKVETQQDATVANTSQKSEKESKNSQHLEHARERGSTLQDLKKNGVSSASKGRKKEGNGRPNYRGQKIVGGRKGPISKGHSF